MDVFEIICDIKTKKKHGGKLRLKNSKMIKKKTGRYDIKPLEVAFTIPDNCLFLIGDLEEYRVGGIKIESFCIISSRRSVGIRSEDQEMPPPRYNSLKQTKNLSF